MGQTFPAHKQNHSNRQHLIQPHASVSCFGPARYTVDAAILYAVL